MRRLWRQSQRLADSTGDAVARASSQPMGRASTVKMIIASRLEEVPRVHEAVRQALEQAGYDKQALFGVRLAMEEALCNAVRHGNCGDPDKKVTVEWAIDEQQVRISVCDEGCGFKPGALADPTLDENLTQPGGRGVLLMRAYMNSVSFNPQGNCVTMVRERGFAGPDCCGR